MAKIDAELLALARREDPRSSSAPTAPPPPARTAVQPPPLMIPFPFPFANTASANSMVAATTAHLGSEEDSFLDVRDSWLLPIQGEGSARLNLRSLLPFKKPTDHPGPVGLSLPKFRSLTPIGEPEPFSFYPSTLSMLPP